MIAVVKEHGPALGYAGACQAVGISRATFYRHCSARPAKTRKRKMPKQALATQERQEVLEVLHEPRFVDLAPNEVFAQLLDEDKYLCSPRTMYRILAQNKEVRERRRQRKIVPYSKPELLATGPNQVWSWDISVLQKAA
jgi:putative transposase